MSAEYTGTVFSGGDSHKIKNLQNRLNALLVAYDSLLAENVELKKKRDRPPPTPRIAKPVTPDKPKKRTRRTPKQMAAARAAALS